MQVFEDLSPRSPGTAKCDVEYSRESSREEITMGLWLRSAQLVTLLLSIAACIWGTFAAGGHLDLFGFFRLAAYLIFKYSPLDTQQHVLQNNSCIN